MNLQIVPSTMNKIHMLPQHVTVTRLPQYLICAGLGAVGGAVGVAAAIGAAIIIQSLLISPFISQINVILVTILAALVGITVSAQLSRAAAHILPGMPRKHSEQALPLTLIVSVITTLLETALYFQGL